WVVNHNGRRTGRAYIKTEYLKDRDLFSIEGEFKLWFSSEMRGIADLTVETNYVVNREGEMREMILDGTWLVGGESSGLRVIGRLDGVVKDGVVQAHVKGKFLGTEFERDLAPIPLTARGSVLNPLQPVNRIWGVRRGQKWRVPLVHPMRDVVAQASGAI